MQVKFTLLFCSWATTGIFSGTTKMFVMGAALVAIFLSIGLLL